MRATMRRSPQMHSSVMTTSMTKTNSALAMVTQNGSLPKLVTGRKRSCA